MRSRFLIAATLCCALAAPACGQAQTHQPSSHKNHSKAEHPAPATTPEPTPTGKADAKADHASPATPNHADDSNAAPPETPKGTSTGLPLPRYAALRSDEVFLRVGPGTRYPIQWVYKRRDLPVRILREFENWRLVEDFEGVKGWVHQATLTGRHTLIIIDGEQTLRSTGNETAEAVARAAPGVIGRIKSCEATAEWCQIQINDYRGWLKRSGFWGIGPGEALP